MSECNHDCGSCSQECGSRITYEKPHELTRVKHVIGVVSGKGGVGKSLVTCLLALGAVKAGRSAAILDADITGPSIPRSFGINWQSARVREFGIKGGIEGDDTGIYPRASKLGIKMISSNLLLENENDPVIWRGPVIAGMVKQFWQEVIWGDVDYMFVDMPPGTGGGALTSF